jgi:kynurenine 3-monooxygenase
MYFIYAIYRENSFDSLQTRASVEHFWKNLPDTIDVIPKLAEDFSRILYIGYNEMLSVDLWRQSGTYWRCKSRYSSVLWTRMNSGFEDISILNEMIEKYGEVGNATKTPNTFLVTK